MTKQESLSSIARRTGVTLATLRAWRKSGVDLHNAKELAAKIANRQPSKPATTGDELHAVKLRKLTAEAQLAEMKAAQVDGKLIGLEDLTICLTKIGHVLKAQLGKMRCEMPVMLYGLSQPEMTKRIGEATDRVLNDICDQLEQIKIDPPKPE